MNPSTQSIAGAAQLLKDDLHFTPLNFVPAVIAFQ